MKVLESLYEWAVWANLDSKKDLETILLKGHLMVEVALDSVLANNDLKIYENYSFYRKISLLKKTKTTDKEKLDLIISNLNTINQLRNKLAHEPIFDIYNGELESWSLNVLENFEGEKFTKYTFRTKIVHAFSVITKSILEVSE